MKKHFLFLGLLIFVLSSFSFARNPTAFINRIEGTIYGPDRRPVENVYVELKNDVDSPMGQTRSNSSGRFSFAGMPSGRYNLKVLPIRTNFAEQTQEVIITNIGRNTSDIAYVDFYLKYDKRSDNASDEKSPETIFVQEVPSAAKKLYEEARKDFKDQPEKSFTQLEEALKIFPEYFDALSLLGKEYVLRGKFEKAYPYLLRAIDANPRSFISFYRLAYAFYRIKEYEASLKAAQAAIVIAPDSPDAYQLFGTVLRITGNLTEAEKNLLKANSLAGEKEAETHWQLALLYNKLKQNQEAIRELEIYLKLKPNAPDKTEIQGLIARLKSAGNK